jgi:hypothetical protein
MAANMLIMALIVITGGVPVVTFRDGTTGHDDERNKKGGECDDFQHVISLWGVVKKVVHPSSVRGGVPITRRA